MIPTVAATATAAKMAGSDGKVGQLRNAVTASRYSAAHQNSGDAANQTEHYRFNKELFHDVACATAHRHAYADFVGAFRDGDEHDVHDSNSADNQGNQRDNQEQVGHDMAGRGKRFGDFG